MGLPRPPTAGYFGPQVAAKASRAAAPAASVGAWSRGRWAAARRVVLASRVLARLPDLVDDALLDVGPREHRRDGLTEPRQVVHRHHQDVLDAAELPLTQRGQPGLKSRSWTAEKGDGIA